MKCNLRKVIRLKKTMEKIREAEQAGADPGQSQLELGLGFTSINWH